MGILMWDTPEKVMSIESWKSISAAESAKEWCEITITMRPGKPEIVSGLTPEEGR